MKKLITYILPLILAISLSGCYTQFQTLNNSQYYGDDYGYASGDGESAYTEGYRSGWTDYSLYAFRDYNYPRFWSNYYNSYYNPFYQPYGYFGFGYTYDPYFSFNLGFLNFGYAPYWGGAYPYYPYPYNYFGFGYYGYGYYSPYYHHYYSYNYYEVPNSGNNIYRHQKPRSFGVQPASGGGGSYGYSRPERGSTYRSSGNSGSSGRSTQGTYSTPRREPRTSGSSGSSVSRGSSGSRPERAPRSSGRSAPAPSSRGGNSNGGSRPDRGGNHQILFNSPGSSNSHSATPQDNGRNYYRPSRNNGNQQQHASVVRSNGYSFHSLIRPDRRSQSTNNSRVAKQETQNVESARTGYNLPRYNRTERPSRSRNIYYHPSHYYSQNSNSGYSRSIQSSNNRSTYTAHHQTFNSFSSPRFDRAPRVSRSGNYSHNSSSGSRPRRH